MSIGILNFDEQEMKVLSPLNWRTHLNGLTFDLVQSVERPSVVIVDFLHSVEGSLPELNKIELALVGVLEKLIF